MKLQDLCEGGYCDCDCSGEKTKLNPTLQASHKILLRMLSTTREKLLVGITFDRPLAMETFGTACSVITRALVQILNYLYLFRFKA